MEQRSPVPENVPPIDPRWTEYLDGPAGHSRPAGTPARHAPPQSEAELAAAIRETLAPWERGEVSARDVLRALRRLADDFG